MTAEHRPLLALGAPEVGERIRQAPIVPPRVSRPSARRQGERLTPQFRELVDAFDAERARLSSGQVDEVDPELVLVFDLAGSIKDFRNAIRRIDGLEFLTEVLDEEQVEPDDDFHMTSQGERQDDMVQDSLYLVMSNATAAAQLISLFQRWQQNPDITFEHGLGKFKIAFEHLRAIRRWGPEDRIRDTGLIDQWRETLAVVGQSHSALPVEIELWYRADSSQRAAAEAHLSSVIRNAGGRVLTRADIGEIAYHTLLAELPIQQITTVLDQGAGAIDLLNAHEIMFVSPHTPMSVPAPTLEPIATTNLTPVDRVPGQPRIALLDGLPFANHDALTGRLVIDDPDGLGETYPVVSRNHGTAMASLVLHGDLSDPGEPLSRPLYVRPILVPHPFNSTHEIVAQGELLTDLLHRAIRRIVEDDGPRPAAARSVRIVNLSIGAESRALVRRISPLGRLLDWLALKYNLLFVVSAGNHARLPVTIPAEATGSPEDASVAAVRAARATSRLRGVLPPADAINALSVGATHDDEAEDPVLPDDVWDLVEGGAPALYSAVGPGVGRSIKPDLYHSGGRMFYQRPVANGAPTVDLVPATTSATGPGSQVAAPGSLGTTNATNFTHGTSNAAALVTRQADRVFEVLEAGRPSDQDFPFPDPQYHPVLAKALLVHTSTWGDHRARLQEILNLDTMGLRRELTPLLGYGSLRPDRLAAAATNRAVLIAGASIGRDERHTYSVPLPTSLRAKAAWHRFTVTLACFTPTAGQLSRYRGAKVFFERLEEGETGGSRIEADHNAVRRGSVQHEIIDGTKALVFQDGGAVRVHVQCMDDAQRLRANQVIRYGLVVSVETAVTTSTTVHDEVRAQLRVRAEAQARTRVQP